MNQQRSRRFRSAQEAEEQKALLEETRQAMKEMGIKVSTYAVNSFILGERDKLCYITSHVAGEQSHDRMVECLIPDSLHPASGWCSQVTFSATGVQSADVCPERLCFLKVVSRVLP